jgi:uncharacterized protein
MGFQLIPRDDVYFDYFDRVTANIVKGVEILQRIDAEERRQHYFQQIRTVEHETDEIVHEALSHLHRTFVTPLDREDIHQLLSTLDDILDLTHGAAGNIALYHPELFPPELQNLVRVLYESVKIVQEMVALLRHLGKNAKRILELTVEVNRLENDADLIRRDAMARLLREETDAIELIKWKDIIASVENATDRCEDVGNLLEGIVLKNS